MDNRKQLHYRYIIGILVSIIIGLISVNWSKIDNLQDYISFALTLSSLVLALIAISYSFHSNESLSSTLTKINESSKEISYLSRNIVKSNHLLKNQVEKVDKNVESYSELIRKSSLENISDDDLLTEKPDSITKSKVLEILSKSSPLGCQALFIGCLTYESQKPLNMEKLINSLSPSSSSNGSYFNAYINCAATFGIFELNNKSARGIHVLDANKTLLNTIEKTLIEKYKNVALLVYKTEESAEENMDKIFYDYYQICDFFNKEYKTIKNL